jgi:hypothetical protein
MTDADLVLGRYRAGPRLAAGAAGTVIAAVDVADGREVVVKLFDGSEDNYAAWVREARLAMRLRHPNIPACLNAGADAATGLSVLVFERARGGSLRRSLAGGRRFAPGEVRRVLADVAAALHYSHAQGVVHRDVKPENILARAAPGEPPWLLADFGAGRFLPAGAGVDAPAGSLHYMAPEARLRGGVAASDQYSLGAVGLELVCGALPDLRARSRLRLRDCDDPGLAGVVARLVDPDAARRFPAVEAAAMCLADPGAPRDVAATRDGSQFVLVGADVLVRRPGDAGLRQVGRVPGARRFLHAWGDAEALLAAEDRLLVLSPHPRAAGPAPPPGTLWVDRARGVVWQLDGEVLCARRFDGGVARGPTLAGWRGGGRAMGLRVGEAAALGVRGVAELVLVEAGADGLLARRIAAPGPLYELRRVHDVPVAVFGDADGVRAAILRDDDLGPGAGGPPPPGAPAAHPPPRRPRPARARGRGGRRGPPRARRRRAAPRGPPARARRGRPRLPVIAVTEPS